MTRRRRRPRTYHSVCGQHLTIPINSQFTQIVDHGHNLGVCNRTGDNNYTFPSLFVATAATSTTTTTILWNYCKVREIESCANESENLFAILFERSTMCCAVGCELCIYYIVKCCGGGMRNSGLVRCIKCERTSKCVYLLMRSRLSLRHIHLNTSTDLSLKRYNRNKVKYSRQYSVQP